jgi:predicted acylesterase/phospholipase RssA
MPDQQLESSHLSRTGIRAEPASDAPARLAFRVRMKIAWTEDKKQLEARTSREWHRHPVLLVLVIWTTLCFLFEAPTVFMKIAALLLAAAYLLHHTSHRLRHFNWAIASGVLMAGVLLMAGSYNLLRDLCLLPLGLLPGAIIFYRELHGGKRLLQTRLLLISAACTWLLWSAGDAAFERKAEPVDPVRFTRLRAAYRYPRAQVGIALSGGGYRAGVLHAGVLSGLETAHIPITHISSVSGGSIIAGYYVRGGSPEDFRRAAAAGRLNLYRDLVDAQNALRLPFPARFPGTDVKLLPFFEFHTTDVQANLLDRRLLSGSTLQQVPGGAPRLMICATDLNSTRAVGITRDWMMERFVLTPIGEEMFPNAQKLFTTSGIKRTAEPSAFVRSDSGNFPMALLVAGSGAVPFAFDPVPFRQLYLADGAVTDNSGMTLLLEASRRAVLNNAQEGDPAWRLDLAISVDAGQLFADTKTPDVSGFSRALDIILHRAGLRRPRELRGKEGAIPQLLLSPSLYVDNSLGAGALARQQHRLSQLVAQQMVMFDAASLAVLAEIARSLPPRTRDEVLMLLATLKDTPKPTSNDKSAANRANQQRRLEAVDALIKDLAPDFTRCLETFLKIGTLSNKVSAAQANELFRLGQYLVVLNAPEINETLAPLVPANERVEPILTEAEQKELLQRWNAPSASTAGQ